MLKIQQLEVENLKRIKACTLTPAPSGLTVIGGRNGQGKTSTLDAIAWALGGEKYRPSQPHREGSVLPPSIRVELSNGIVVERKGKNSSLKVIDAGGHKSGQQLLNEFISQISIDLPKFMVATPKDKATFLLRIIGVGDQLQALDEQETQLYNQRLAVGRIADQKVKYAKELPSYPDVPDVPVPMGDLIRQQQDILARNGENQRKREKADALRCHVDAWTQKVQDIREQLMFAERTLADYQQELHTAETAAQDLQDESTAELEAALMDMDEINRRIRANLDREKALEDAKLQSDAYNALSREIESVRQRRTDLLNGAKMPLDGLSVDHGELTYHGQRWDCMSGAEQLMVGTAIARAMNPQCGFVLLDKLEQMDTQTLMDFGGWLEQEGLQVIATRVSTGDECSVIIEDGFAVQPAREEIAPTPPAPPAKPWQKGVF